MIIGFDAKRAFYNSTGLGNYSRTLIRSLAEFYPQHTYKLFAPKKTDLFSVSTFKNIQTITPSGFSGILKSAWRSKGMVKDLMREKVEIYHGLSHEIPMGIQKTGIKTVVTIHDLIHEKFPEQYKAIDRKIYSAKFRFACENADRIIAISEQTKKDIIEIYGVNSSKISVVYQSADPVFLQKATEEEKKHIHKRYQLPENFILSVGSIIERKNLLQVAKAMKGTPEDLKLVVIGDGKESKQKVKEYVAKNLPENKVIFLNEKYTIPFSDFPALYQLSKALIYISSYEGFGLPVLEGIMSGIPVITSNVSCLPEAGGDCAFYVNPENTEEIKGTIEKIISEGSGFEQKIKNYPGHLEKFENKRLTTEVMDVYKGL